LFIEPSPVKQNTAMCDIPPIIHDYPNDSGSTSKQQDRDQTILYLNIVTYILYLILSFEIGMNRPNYKECAASIGYSNLALPVHVNFFHTTHTEFNQQLGSMKNK
jgi:hypothetical protein